MFIFAENRHILAAKSGIVQNRNFSDEILGHSFNTIFTLDQLGTEAEYDIPESG